MTLSAAHADAFCREALRENRVWGICDENGFPAPTNGDGVRAMPFWSLRTRADRVIANVDAYAGFEPVAIALAEFRRRWLPGLTQDELLVGLNWSGERATGFDAAAADVEARFAATERSGPQTAAP